MMMNVRRETFGKKIKRLREQADLTQAELARLSGVGRTSIVRLESGERTGLSAVSLVQLARALGVSVEELISYTDFA